MTTLEAVLMQMIRSLKGKKATSAHPTETGWAQDWQKVADDYHRAIRNETMTVQQMGDMVERFEQRAQKLEHMVSRLQSAIRDRSPRRGHSQATTSPSTTERIAS